MAAACFFRQGPDFVQAQSQPSGLEQRLSNAGGFVRSDKQTQGCAQPVHCKKILKNEKGRRKKKKRKENKGSDKGMPSTKALCLIISVVKTSPVAFHPSKLTSEGTGNTDIVLLSTV